MMKLKPEHIRVKGNEGCEVGSGQWFEWTILLDGQFSRLVCWGGQVTRFFVGETEMEFPRERFPAGSEFTFGVPVPVLKGDKVRIEVIVTNPTTLEAQLDYERVVCEQPVVWN